ncbi:hypothetical protein XENTR_v10014069 [Xenopus tropicalis]|nr:hypothetical protein XENTR_v10014069 [Xenopus tropicalis]
MRILWWICFLILIFSHIYEQTATNDASDDDDDDGYDEENLVTNVPNTAAVQVTNIENIEYKDSGNENRQQSETTNIKNDDYEENSNDNRQQSETEDPEQARAKLKSSQKNRTELGILKDLIMKIDENNQRNLIIICSVMGSGLFLIIVVLLCLVAHIAELDE